MNFTWPTGIQSSGRGRCYKNMANWYTEIRHRKMNYQHSQLGYRAQAEEDELQEPGQLICRAQAEEDELQEPGQLVYRAQAEEDELQDVGSI